MARQDVYQVIAHYRATNGRAEAVAENLTRLATASRQERQNLSYEVARSLDDANHFVIVEAYTSPEGFERHHESPHFQEIGVGRILPDLESRTVTAFQKIGDIA